MVCVPRKRADNFQHGHYLNFRRSFWMVTLLITNNKRNRKTKIFVLTFIQHFSKHI